MRIHIVVPITSDSFNEQIAEEARGFVGDGIGLEVSCLPYGPASIESFYDEVLAGPAIAAEAVRAESQGADAVFITCFGDPAVPAARELVDIPVVGGFEPAVTTALNLGERFSVVTVLENVVPMISMLASRMGVGNRMASIEVIDTPVLELHDGDVLLKNLFEASCRALDAGCRRPGAGLHRNARRRRGAAGPAGLRAGRRAGSGSDRSRPRNAVDHVLDGSEAQSPDLHVSTRQGANQRCRRIARLRRPSPADRTRAGRGQHAGRCGIGAAGCLSTCVSGGSYSSRWP